MKTKHKYGPRTLPKPRGWMHQGLDGSRYQLIDVLGGEVEGDLWRMLRMSGDAAKMKSRIGVMVWKVARGDEGEG